MEKTVCRTSETAVHESPLVEDVPIRAKKNIVHARWTVLLGIAVPCIPILAIVVLMIYLVHSGRYNVEGNPLLQPLPMPTVKKPGLRNDWNRILETASGPTILTHRSATLIITISAWTSKLLPYLTGTIMGLVAFFAARQIVTQSEEGDAASMLSPAQLTVLIELLSGDSFLPLIHAMSLKKKTGDRLIAPIPMAFWTLLSLTSLSLMIPVIDTWFGTATSSVPWSYLIDATNATPARIAELTTGPADNPGFGRELNTTMCQKGANGNQSTDSLFWPCDLVVNETASSDVNLFHVPAATSALMAQRGTPQWNWSWVESYPGSNRVQLASYEQNGQSYSYYLDYQSRSFDYKSTSPAISTQCKTITQQCMNSSSTGNFSCSQGFYGNVEAGTYPTTFYPEREGLPGSAQGNDDLGIMFSKDANLSFRPQEVTTNLSNGQSVTHPELIVQNPAYFGFWARNYPPKTTLEEQSNLMSDNDDIPAAVVYNASRNPTAWFLSCSTTLYTVTFTWVNGTITTFEPVLMEPEEAALFTTPLHVFPYDDTLDAAMVELAAEAELAVYSERLLEPLFSAVFSRTALALAIGVMDSAPNSASQWRQTPSVMARIPLVPFWLLISLKLCFVLVVTGLAIGAYAFAQPAETDPVLEKLSLKGLAGSFFDDPRLVQKNAVAGVQGLSQIEEKTRMEDDQGATVSTTDGKQTVTVSSLPVVSAQEPVKVGLIPDADGAWKYMLRANGAWHALEPLVSASVKAISS